MEPGANCQVEIGSRRTEDEEKNVGKKQKRGIIEEEGIGNCYRSRRKVNAPSREVRVVQKEERSKRNKKY